MDTNDLIIRAASPEDLPAIGKLGALLMRAHHEFDPERFMRPADAEGYGSFLATQLQEPEVVVLVAQREGEIVGYVYAGMEPVSWKELRERAGFIHDVVVRETHRRTGVAEALLAAAIERLRTLGAPRVLLWTAVQNEAAQRLFAGMGFRATMIEMTREMTATR